MVLFLFFTTLIVGIILYIYLVRPKTSPVLKGNVQLDDGTPVLGAQVSVLGMDGFKETDKTGWFQFQVNDQKSWTVRAVLENQNVHMEWPKANLDQPLLLKFPKRPIKKAIVKVGKDILAKQWQQAASGDSDQRRKVTSLYIPLSIENPRMDKDIVLRNVRIVDKKSGTILEPPKSARVMVDENRHLWLFQACDIASPSIFNAGQPITIPKGQFIDTAIMIQENNIHRPDYQLEVTFTDSQDVNYKLEASILVEKYASSTVWPT